jgi:hypothetical protein
MLKATKTQRCLTKEDNFYSQWTFVYIFIVLRKFFSGLQIQERSPLMQTICYLM